MTSASRVLGILHQLIANRDGGMDTPEVLAAKPEVPAALLSVPLLPSQRGPISGGHPYVSPYLPYVSYLPYVTVPPLCVTYVLYLL